MADSKDLALTEGHSYSFVLRWATEPIVRKAISAITAPNGAARIAATAHGMPDGWDCVVTNAKGMTEINALDPNNIRDSEFTPGTVLDADTVELNKINAAGFKTYTTGGFLQYNTPVSLTGHTQRCRLRNKKGGKLLLCTAGGTTGATKPSAAGSDGTVTWAEGTPAIVEKVWVANTVYAQGDTIDVSVLASSDLADAPYNVLTLAIDTAAYTTTLTFPVAASVLLSGKTGYYDVDDTTTSTGAVTQLVYGTVKVEKE